MDQITYVALPFPLPQDAQAALKEASKNAQRYRTPLQRGKDIEVLDVVIRMLKQKHGTKVTRESFK